MKETQAETNHIWNTKMTSMKMDLVIYLRPFWYQKYEIPPTTMPPKVTNTPIFIRPTVLNLTTVSPTIPMIPTLVPPNRTNATDSNSQSAMPTAVSGIVIEDPVPTSNTSITTNVPTICIGVDSS